MSVIQSLQSQVGEMNRLLAVLVIVCVAAFAFAQNADPTPTEPSDQSNQSAPAASEPATAPDAGQRQETQSPDAQTDTQNPPAAESASPTPPTTQTAPQTAAPANSQSTAPASTTPATSPPPARATASSGDETKAGERIQAAGSVVDEIMAAPDKGIPEEVMGSAECVAVVPSLLKGGFIVGGRYGRGVASCRTPKGWSAPAFFTVKGGSVGLQIGGQAVDLIMLVMNEQGMRNLLSSKFQIGADASAAAGPVGRHAEGETDWKMRAQILTYSRARGVFAGITLNGAVVKQDKESTREFYGRMVPFRTALTGQIQAPDAANPFLSTLSKFAKEAAAK
jgi:lipid-binding SYLF domain-containing protein